MRRRKMWRYSPYDDDNIILRVDKNDVLRAAPTRGVYHLLSAMPVDAAIRAYA